MSETVNPYIAGSPVTGTEMFFGREDVFGFIRQALTGQHRDNVIVLYGQRRTGKTSVLYQMRRHLNARYLPIFVDLHGLALEGLNGFIGELANHITRVLHRDFQIDLPRLNRAEFRTDPRSHFENEFLNQVWSVIGDRHILLMLDEAIRLQEQVRAGKLEKEVFEYLRHLMQHHERLNFLFSLGSGLEEMEKEYSFLFSVGLYKKISFLSRDAATDLITQPVRDYYKVEAPAVERILYITSGHPYYTQLLCHSLFNRWQRQMVDRIRMEDVDAILGEVVERGLAVLKHVWEESTAGEKAIMAGMAAAMGEDNRPVHLTDIDRVWARQNVKLPEGERAKAIKRLIARDVIAGRDKYVFTVDLQRLWVQKYERLEWVKEEISGEAKQWKENVGLPKLVPRSKLMLIVTSLIAMAILIFLALRSFSPISIFPRATTTRAVPSPPPGYTLQETLVVPGNGELVVSSLLLEKGVTYKIMASDLSVAGGNGDVLADAEYADFSHIPSSLQNYCGYSPSGVDLGIGINDPINDNNKFPFWGDYDPSHVYTVDFVGQGMPITVNYHDCDYHDNSGSLRVHVFRPSTQGFQTMTN